MKETYIRNGMRDSRQVDVDGEYGVDGGKGRALCITLPYAANEEPYSLAVDITVSKGGTDIPMKFTVTVERQSLEYVVPSCLP